MNGHFNNAIPIQPHTFAMREKAADLRATADRMTDCNIAAETHVYDYTEIDAMRVMADDLDRFSLWEVALASPCYSGLSRDCHEKHCDCRESARARFAVSLPEYKEAIDEGCDCNGTGEPCDTCKAELAERTDYDWVSGFMEKVMP